MGADVAGIGRRNEWPCVGDPDGEMFGCAAVGAISLLAIVPMGHLAEPLPDVADEDPVVVHITVCPRHVRAVRGWVLERMHPDDSIDTYGTEYLMRQWGQVVETMGDTPILRMQRTA